MYYRGDDTSKNYNLALQWAATATKSDNLRAKVLYQYLLNNPSLQ